MKYGERTGIEPELHFQYYVKHPGRGMRGVWKGSVKWRKGVAACHNGTMHVTGNITPEMPPVLARGEVGAREEDRIDCEKEEERGGEGSKREREKDRHRQTERETAKGFFCIVAVYRREFSSGRDCLFR